ncbi:Iron-uptake factor PiuC [Methylophaga frappieri]|uniref:Iron-uptake factor PiuC n=2 Tax=Methylophaga frappieri (strain ATCC BAA-2434 / DSM 25690 / JAM7) TaxID=754477 RepID=I1YKK2_METFJ|nr:Iron-uptake factor PiuC [Methylophaga frappieri]
MKLIRLYTAENAQRILDAARELELKDGRETAKGYAKNIKNNLQAGSSNPKAAPLLAQIQKNLYDDARFRFLTFPKLILSLRFAHYPAGGKYDWHFDNAHMDARRADLSFTLFLNDDYEGGELEMDFGHFKSRVKGKAGEIVIYDTGVRHRVNPVTKGERWCLVGWVHSLIPLPADRRIVQLLGEEMQAVRKARASAAEDQEGEDGPSALHEIYQYLCRRFSG